MAEASPKVIVASNERREYNGRRADDFTGLEAEVDDKDLGSVGSSSLGHPVVGTQPDRHAGMAEAQLGEDKCLDEPQTSKDRSTVEPQSRSSEPNPATRGWVAELEEAERLLEGGMQSKRGLGRQTDSPVSEISSIGQFSGRLSTSDEDSERGVKVFDDGQEFYQDGDDDLPTSAPGRSRRRRRQHVQPAHERALLAVESEAVCCCCLSCQSARLGQHRKCLEMTWCAVTLALLCVVALQAVALCHCVDAGSDSSVRRHLSLVSCTGYRRSMLSFGVCVAVSECLATLEILLLFAWFTYWTCGRPTWLNERCYFPSTLERLRLCTDAVALITTTFLYANGLSATDLLEEPVLWVRVALFVLLTARLMHRRYLEFVAMDFLVSSLYSAVRIL